MLTFLALPSWRLGGLGFRQMWSFDKECQFSALGMPYVLRKGERTVVPRRKMGHRKHTTRIYTYELRQILLGLIKEDFLEEGSFLE